VTFSGTVVPIQAIDGATRDAMLTLLCRHFDGVRAREFAQDLAEKDQAMLVHGEAGALVGFSTFKFWRTRVRGEPRRVLFSGDTIVAPEAWRSPIAIRTWLRAALEHAAAGPEPLDWFLLSSGHRTFRIMTTVFRDHFPSAEGERPALRERLEVYATERYGDRFVRERGIVRLARSVHRLRPGVGDVTEARLHDPAVALFAARNPGHLDGDELCCLCQISAENLTAAGRRFLGAGP
jgi:hypothetical protein